MVRKHIDEILDIIKKDQPEIEHVSNELFKKSYDIAESVGVELTAITRIVQEQIHLKVRLNTGDGR